MSGILAGGHVLLEDLPGLGKTLIARSFATVLGLDFARIQFTPDLLPSDVVGAPLYDQRTGEMVFRPGPVFTQLLLADEINRTPPKTQAALLEAMGESQVSMDGVTRRLPQPFVVLATDNPIEYEGTYELPEAQLDRFLLRLRLGYLQAVDETAMLQRRIDRQHEELELRRSLTRPSCWRCARSLEQIEVSPGPGRLRRGYRRRHPRASADPGRRQSARQPGARAARQGPGAAAAGATTSSPTTSSRSRCRRWRTGSRCGPSCGCARCSSDDVVARLLDTVPVPAPIRRRPLAESARIRRSVRVTWALSAHARRLLTMAIRRSRWPSSPAGRSSPGVAAPPLVLLATWRTDRPAELSLGIDGAARPGRRAGRSQP